MAFASALGMRCGALVSSLCLLGGLLAPDAAEAEARFVDGQRWGLEIGLGGGWSPRGTPYTRTLETFGFDDTLPFLERDFPNFRFSAAVEAILLPYFSVLLQTNLLDHREWYRDSGTGPDDRFQWSSWTLDVHARGFYPFQDWCRVYAQLGVGPTFTATRLTVRTSGDTQTTYRQAKVGYNIAGLGGFELTSKHVGFFVQGGYFFAPSPKNRFGDKHQSGGGLLLGGLSAHFGRSR